MSQRTRQKTTDIPKSAPPPKKKTAYEESEDEDSNDNQVFIFLCQFWHYVRTLISSNNAKLFTQPSANNIYTEIFHVRTSFFTFFVFHFVLSKCTCKWQIHTVCIVVNTSVVLSVGNRNRLL